MTAATATVSRPGRRSGSSGWRPDPWRRSASRRRSVASVASVNTGTATTATAESAGEPRAPRPGAPPYIGRFAPSPTGALHTGSLAAALASFLDARHCGGRWLLRIEDLDTPRVIPGSEAQILRTLDAFGLQWDGEILRQSTRLEHYAAALRQLDARGLTYACSCSRRELREGVETGYPGTCRSGPRRSGVPTATRLRLQERGRVCFEDRIQGPCGFSLDTLGDVVLRRKDGLFAYQLAVVVDDAAQQVTDVVRGADLLESTAWQLILQQDLGFPSPRYAHVPLITEAGGAKLAKSRRSVAVNPDRAAAELHRLLELLRQAPPPELARDAPGRVLEWACRHWNPAALAGVRTLPLE